MCGLIAMIARNGGGFFHRDAEQFEQMLVVNGMLRGKHSTGVFQVLKNRQAFLYKNAVDPMMYLFGEEWQSMRQRMISNARIMVGHGRHATKGSINSENAHPFYENNILLVHNGTLYGHKQLADTEVDSHAVCKAFAEKPAEEVIPTINGAFAFIWYDMAKEKLFAVRNNDRPLYLITTPSKYILTSESWYVRNLLLRDKEPAQNIEVLELPAGRLFEFNLTTPDYTSREIELKKVIPTQVVVHTQVQTTQSTHVGGDGNNRTGVVDNRVTTKQPQLSGNLFGYIDKAYKAGDRVMIKITQINTPATDKVKSAPYAGQIIHPGKPQADCRGLLLDVDPPDYQNYFKGPVVGQVDRITYHSGGPVVHLVHTKMDKIVNTWSGTIGEVELDHVCESELCFGCTSILYKENASVMSFSRKSVGQKAEYRCYCPDCIETGLSKSGNEEHIEIFQARRAALQAGQSVSQESSRSSNVPALLASPKGTQ